MAEPEPADAAPQRAAGRGKIPTIVAAAGAALIVIGVLVGLLLWRFSGGSTERLEGPEATPTPTLTPRSGTPAPVQEVKVGQRTNIVGLYGKGSVMITRTEWSDKGDLPPGEGKRYLNVELRYDCSEGILTLSKNQYAAYDLAKKEYLPGIGSGKDPIPDGEVRPGQQPVTGWVSIEMPPGQTLFVVSDEGINPLVIVDIP
ncbi:hypothetical protein GCM10028815_27190 [Mariniluteicoccus flavus]